MKRYDLAIIGSGPGGYVAALYASRHKLKVCIIEKDILGGTCLNRGCIPTKSLISSASIIECIKDGKSRGIDVSGYSIDYHKMADRKAESVSRLRSGIETLFRAANIDLIKGCAEITGRGSIRIAGSEDISASNIIIATGSVSMPITDIDTDEEDVLTSDGLLDLKEIPESLAVIGGGVIGCEFASLYNMLGSKVTIVEFTERLLPTQSREVSKKLEMLFKKRGIEVFTSSKAESIVRGSDVRVELSGLRSVAVKKVLISIGRKPYTESLGDLSRIGLKMDGSRIHVDDHLMTDVPGIYAIGDCVAGPMLAHKASYDGMLACDNIIGKMRVKDYSNIPNCIWTEPEIASVGISEEEAKLKFPGAKIAKFPYLASGKAYIIGKSEGFVKMIGDPDGRILGVEIFGANACELIAEAVLARTAGISIEEWSRVVHAHPTLSEILQEAAHIFCGTPIHSI